MRKNTISHDFSPPINLQSSKNINSKPPKNSLIWAENEKV